MVDIKGQRKICTAINDGIKHLSPQSPAYLEAILETAVDAIVTIDGRGHILSFNRAATRMFGYEPAEVLRQNVKMLMPSPFRESHDRYISNYLTTGKAHIIGIGREVPGLRKDGTTFPIELAVSEVREDGQPYFIGIMRDVTERRYLETALVNAIENERREIGRDLHDALGQIITGISLMSKSLAKRLAHQDERLAAEVESIVAMCAEAMAETKRLALGAYPTELERQGLKTALVQLLETTRKLHRIETHFSGGEEWQPLDPAAELHLYRIAQESVSNAVKHAEPRNIHICLAQRDGVTCLTVRDDGKGMPAQRDPDKISMGLDIMKHRAALIGGEWVIQPGAGGGTEVNCCIQRSYLVSRKA